jgi:chromosome segregation ATPase
MDSLRKERAKLERDAEVQATRIASLEVECDRRCELREEREETIDRYAERIMDLKEGVQSLKRDLEQRERHFLSKKPKLQQTL